ncbi:MAG: class I SAM-dependent rRNA methyltransferase [Deltaproteobacteria bacterium]|nr:class I SAM-dependent rRNA methyltransferase [Deltaproteobacteria bacterium]
MSSWNVDAGTVRLKQGKDKAIRRRHPWIFSGAIAAVEGDPKSGDVVVVKDAFGAVLGRGSFSPSSQIRVRMLTFDNAVVDDAFVFARVKRAVRLRQALVLDEQTTSARLIFAESDGLPGVIVDVYGDTAVMQCQSAGAERMRDVVVNGLLESIKLEPPLRQIYERSDADIRTLEGLAPRKGLLHGAPLQGLVSMKEHGLRFDVDVDAGHKTGFYLDQRDSRQQLREVARGRRVLNCFCYTGGFSVAALAGGATNVVSVDSSQPALELGQQNALNNGFSDDKHEWLRGDCFEVLKGLKQDGERFDVVVLDPPKFAAKAEHRDRAARAYKDLMIRGLALLNEGGLLFTFSCSGAVERADFRLIAAQAAFEAQRPCQVVAELGHAKCHPVSTSFPEGEYLKGLLLAV